MRGKAMRRCAPSLRQLPPRPSPLHPRLLSRRPRPQRQPVRNHAELCPSRDPRRPLWLRPRLSPLSLPARRSARLSPSHPRAQSLSPGQWSWWRRLRLVRPSSRRSRRPLLPLCAKSIPAPPKGPLHRGRQQPDRPLPPFPWLHRPPRRMRPQFPRMLLRLRQWLSLALQPSLPAPHQPLSPSPARP